jgi:GNAT superfamily N-acetyltransferase
MRFTARKVGRHISVEEAQEFLQTEVIDRIGKCFEAFQDIRSDVSDGHTIVEARDGARLCGVAVYRLQENALYLEAICSDCSGTGSALIRELTTHARKAGKSSIRLISLESAVPFYEDKGFKMVNASTREMKFDLPNLGGRRKTYRGRKQKRRSSRKTK